jgi:hypothetical protein
MGRFEISCHTLRRNPPAAAAADDAVVDVYIFLAIKVGCIFLELCREAGVDTGQCRRLRNAILPRIFTFDDGDENNRSRSKLRRFSCNDKKPLLGALR